MMGPNGAVDPTVLGDNATLDLLAVKYVVMKASDLGGTDDTFERHETTWAREPLRLSVGEPECGQTHPRSASYALPERIRIATLHIALHLGCSEDVRQGQSVGTLRIVSSETPAFERDLRAGIEVAEQNLNDLALAGRAGHTPAELFDTNATPQSYYLRIDLAHTPTDARVEIETSTSGWLEIDRLTVVDEVGQQFPQRMPEFVMRDSQRWESLRPFFSSEVTDRVLDESTEEERQYVAFASRRAQPRAWVSQEVVPLSSEHQLRTAHYSYLPDGQCFDPARTAMVEPGTLERTTWPPGPGSARITDVRDGFFSIDVTTIDGGFLVLSEGWSPSWRARLDDQPLGIQRANVSLMGVVVPAGRHVVTFEFVSHTFRAGASLSLLTLVALVFIMWRRPGRGETD